MKRQNPVAGNQPLRFPANPPNPTGEWEQILCKLPKRLTYPQLGPLRHFFLENGNINSRGLEKLGTEKPED
jgi:hypothetical protein